LSSKEWRNTNSEGKEEDLREEDATVRRSGFSGETKAARVAGTTKPATERREPR
jgi:hypothetical protein